MPSSIHVASSPAAGVLYARERYHRAFECELAFLAALAQRLRIDEESLHDLAKALATLGMHLREHESLQESALFPAFETGTPCTVGQFEAWAADTLHLLHATDALIRACGRVDLGRGLRARMAHFVDEIRDHLTYETTLFARWTGDVA